MESGIRHLILFLSFLPIPFYISLIILPTSPGNFVSLKTPLYGSIRIDKKPGLAVDHSQDYNKFWRAIQMGPQGPI